MLLHIDAKIPKNCCDCQFRDLKKSNGEHYCKRWIGFHDREVNISPDCPLKIDNQDIVSDQDNFDIVCLNKNMVKDLVELSHRKDFPYELTEESAMIYCQGEAFAFAEQSVQTYGAYYGDKLVGVMTATFCRVFPCNDSPHGKIVQISGAYTCVGYRHRGAASKLLHLIEEHALEFGADYLCCDSIADEFYVVNGFIYSEDGRMWKPFA